MWRQLECWALSAVPVSTCCSKLWLVSWILQASTDTLDKTEGRMGPTSPRLSGLKQQSGTASWKGWALKGKNPEWPWTALPVACWFCSFPGTNPSRHHCSLPEGAAMDTGRKEPSVRYRKGKDKKRETLDQNKEQKCDGCYGYYWNSSTISV